MEKKEHEQLLNRIAASRGNVLRQMLGLTRNLTNGHAIAEDLTQEALIKAIRSSSTFRQECNLGSWMYTVARSVFLDYYLNKGGIKGLSTVSFDDLEHTEVGAHLEAVSENHTEQKYIRRLLQKSILKEARRTLDPRSLQLLIWLMQGLTYNEIAYLTGWPEGTVKSRLNRLRSRLRTRFSSAAGF